jgi:hypothetical protein
MAHRCGADPIALGHYQIAICRSRLAGESVRSVTLTVRVNCVRQQGGAPPRRRLQRAVFAADRVGATGGVLAGQQPLNTLRQERLLLGEALELDCAAGGRGVDESPLADIDAGVADVRAATGGEEHQIAGL